MWDKVWCYVGGDPSVYLKTGESEFLRLLVRRQL